MTVYLFLLQRLTALILVPLVIIHLVIIVIAVRGGLSGVEILARTQGSVTWAMFYGLFVICAAVHGGIGLRNILAEWTPLRGPSLNLLMFVVMIVLMVLGLRAVYAVVAV